MHGTVFAASVRKPPVELSLHQCVKELGRPTSCLGQSPEVVADLTGALFERWHVPYLEGNMEPAG